MLTKGKIIKQVNLNNNYYRIKIKAPQIAKEAKPGQFVMLSKWKIKEIFLKRPFSFYKIESNLGTFDILYKKIGKGTKILAESKIGDLVELIGPLGNGFKIPKNTHNIAIVARGIGIATLMPLILESKKKGLRFIVLYLLRRKIYFYTAIKSNLFPEKHFTPQMTVQKEQREKLLIF